MDRSESFKRLGLMHMFRFSKALVDLKTFFVFWCMLGLCRSGIGHAETLSETALFQRCFGQLTQRQPENNDPLLLAVNSGTKTAIDACLEVLDSAKFTTAQGTRVSSTPGENTLHVLETMNKLHASWFSNKDFPNVGGAARILNGIRDIYDTETPAFYFTRALFRTGERFDSVLTLATGLRSVRQIINPDVGVATGARKEQSIFGIAAPLAGKGRLLGVTPVSNLVTSYSYLAGTQTRSGSLSLGKNYGGGVLGETAYLRLTVGEEANFKSDGGENMPRKWARSVYSDLLCRELPVVRRGDVGSFVAPSSPVAFRVSSGCVQCHASMDRMASVIRGVRYEVHQPSDATVIGGDFISFLPVDKPAEATWPTQPLVDYANRPPQGVLFFRDYLGRLINTNVEGPTALGLELAKTDDFYICAAKRYYNYFMGINVDLVDPADPDSPTSLQERDRFHLDRVITLGRALRASQSSRQLIEQILRLEDYKQSGFGLGKRS